MSSDNSHPLTVPPFASKLPPEFVQDLDERGRYLYTTMDEIKQAQAWLTQRAVEHTAKLEEVSIQTTATNGRLIKAEGEIKEIKVTQEEAKPALKLVNIGLALLKSRLFWLGVSGVVFFVIPWLAVHAPTPSEFFLLVFGG